MTDVATVPNGHVHTPPQSTDEQIGFGERATKRPCLNSDGTADRLAASLDATVPFSAVHEWWQGVRLSLQQAEMDLAKRQQQMVAVEALLKERFAELQRREASVAAREASVGHREAALAILLPRLEVSNVAGAAHAPVTPQHSTQDGRHTGSKRPGPEDASPPPGVDPDIAAELAAAATRMPGGGPTVSGAEAAGVGSRTGSPMAFDQIVPALDDRPGGGNTQGGITFRPIAVHNRADGALAPGGWRFGGCGADSAGWNGGAGGTPFRLASFAASGMRGPVKHEPPQQQQQAAAAHSANGGADPGAAGQGPGGGISRVASGQLAPEPSLRGALLERSGDSNAGANGGNRGDMDSLSLLPHDNHAELPLEGRDANGRKVMRRSCSRTTLSSGNGHASLTSGEAACSEGTTAHELSEAHSGEAPDRRRDAQGAWAWERTGTSAGERHPLSLKLDLAGAAAEASQQGMSSDLWKGGADNQHAVHDQAVSGVKDATSSLQDLAALCANADEVTSPGSPIAHGAGTKEPAVRLSEVEMAAMDTSPDPLSVARTSLNSCGTTARGSGRRKRVRAKSHGPEDVAAPRSRQASPGVGAREPISPAGSSSSGGTTALEALGNKAAKRASQVAPGGGPADSALSTPRPDAPVANAAPQLLPTGAPVAAYSKTLDYKSCQTIMCLTKEMARHLLPSVPASITATGASCQLPVDVVDELGRVWAMTYRCVPHRYSYEFRAGWKPFAAAWRVSAGDTVLLERHTPDRSKLHIKVMKPVRHKSASSAASAAAAAAAKARNRALLEVVQQAAVAEHLDT